ncbi:MAG: DUF1566 domain-containing protein [Prevotellaceae bacterium]|nr:DUF1566 domain-containing protein [Prevotellaceae bacterium]
MNDRGYLNGYEWVDLGLSVMWATCNVGASSPYDCGGYYAWGETFGKNSYDERNSRTFGADMGSIAGNPSYDAARANWGASWRLPTEAEARELTQKCEWTSTSMNGVKGYEVKGPNGNSIFLPAAGGFGEPSQIYNISPRGCYYWTGTPFGVDPRKATCFGRGMDYTGRGCGLTVRAVAD